MRENVSPLGREHVHKTIHETVNPHSIDGADVVIGIPSYREADNIAYPTRVIDRGLQLWFPQYKAVIVNVDNASEDDTKSAFLNTPTRTPKMYVSTPPGIRGKGYNILNLLKVGVSLNAQYIAMFDADLTSIQPAWVAQLLEPLIDGHDFVVPLYPRHKFDGTITNNIAYPLTRSLYGKRVRQPIGGEFGVSSRLARCFLVEKTWSEFVYAFGIDVWMTTTALCRDFKICQTFMTAPKSHRPKDPVRDLAPMFVQVTGTIFQLMKDFSYLWQETKKSYPTTIYGFSQPCHVSIREILVNRRRLKKGFVEGLKTYGHIWKRVLETDMLHWLEQVPSMKPRDIVFPSTLWAHVLYDFSIYCRVRTITTLKERVKALIPLYFLRVLSFVNICEHFRQDQAEEFIEETCRDFEKEKHYLIEKWKSAENMRNEVNGKLEASTLERKG